MQDSIISHLDLRIKLAILLVRCEQQERSGAPRQHTGNVPYLDFIAPGILAQSVLFVAIFYGINVIWERDLGIVQKFLASPTPRAALVLGKGFSAGIRTLSQAGIVYGLSLLIGVKLNWRPLALLNVVIVVVLVVCGEQINHYPARRGRA